MSWIDRPEVRISRQGGHLTAETRGDEVLRYDTYEVMREPGTMESVCPTLDHIIAAAGW